MSLFRWNVAAWGLLGLTGIGCGGGENAAISGAVTLDGKPLAHAAISLARADGTGLPSEGVSDEAGRFILTSSRRIKGVPSGEYIVVVTQGENAGVAFSIENVAEQMEKAQKEKEKANAEAKKLPKSAEPPPMQLPPKTTVLHENYANFEKSPLRLKIPPRWLNLALKSDGT